MSLTRHDRLNKIGQIISAKNYLEIGVREGVTFLSIDIASKVAVDPVLRFDYNKTASEDCLYYEKTSDKFFSQDLLDKRFDLIFLDGLHTFDQTFRDFTASISRSHDNTVWLIDDVIPTGFLASCSDSLPSKLARKITHRNLWMGDVFKVIFTIHDFFPQYNYATFIDHGQTLVWKEVRKDFKPTWNSLNKISKISYFSFLRHKNKHFNLRSEEDIFQLLTDRMSTTADKRNKVV